MSAVPRDWVPGLEAEMRRAGATLLAVHDKLDAADVHWKQDTSGEPSVVTRWDLEIESQFRDYLGREFPAHSFLGEETGNDRRDPAHYWLLDPIDGTSNFVDGIPYWGTSLAYWHAGRIELGLVHFPVLGRMFVAVRGGGAWADGQRLCTPPVRQYTARSCIALDSRSHLRHTLHLRSRVRILGSAIANLCFTATGVFVASCTRGMLWDVAAGDLLLREAGAVVESTPEIAGLDPARSALDGAPSEPRITLLARASAELPSLAGFLRPAANPPAAAAPGHS